MKIFLYVIMKKNFNNNKNFLIMKIFIPVILFCGNKMFVWGWCGGLYVHCYF